MSDESPISAASTEKSLSRESAQRILEMADDELVLGWRDSEWTGIAPFLEEDVAFSSIAQGEIGHARALYELAAGELGTDADSLAFDRSPNEYRCAPLVELRLVHDWAGTIARHWLYETADALRVAALMESDWPELAGLAAKMDREEAYHRMHAQMWADRLRGSAERERFETAVEELWPAALGLLEGEQRNRLCELVGREPVEAVGRDEHTDELAPLWEEMTMVRRSVPGATW
jgi:ring-1,2-phenylacetyl-CoA epoxidase subunit PaaC